MIFGIVLFGFFSIVFRFSSCRWLVLGEWAPDAQEEKLCVLFAGLSRNLAALLFLLLLIRPYAGCYSYWAAGALALLSIVSFLVKTTKTLL